MLSRFFLFYILYWLLGNPLLALLIILLIVFTIDRTFLGFIPDPFKAFKRSGRLRQLRRLVSINPHDARSLKELGILMVEKNEYQTALEYFEKASSKMSDDPEFIYYHGLSAARSGNIAKGWELVDTALSTSPELKYGEPYLMMAEVYIENNDFRSALPLLENFLKIHSSSSRGFYQMGIVKMNLGMKNEAGEFFRKSIDAFKASPRFKRKLDRRWAWKSRFMLKKI